MEVKQTKVKVLIKINEPNKQQPKNVNKNKSKYKKLTEHSFKEVNNEKNESNNFIKDVATDSDCNDEDNKIEVNSELKDSNKKVNLKLNKNEIFNFKKNIDKVKNSHLEMISRRSLSLFLLLRTLLSEKLIYQCILLSVCANSVFGVEQKFAIEPQDQSAVVGSRVTLPCRVVNKSGQLQWTKDDFGLGTHRHLAGYERYKMIGSDDEGDYSLDIRDVTIEDDALYQCQVSTGPHGEQPIRSRYARLLILVPPEAPRILQGTSIEAIEDQDLSLECLSVGGKPAAEITWVDSEGGVLTQGVTYAIEPMSDGRRFTARSVLSLRPRRHHHNQTFMCQAQNIADRAFKAASIRILVKHAPKVRLTVKNFGPKDRIKEGNTVILGCQASANPSDMTYRWYINNEYITGSNTNELVIKNVSRKYNEGLVKCEVSNSIGKSADSKILEISYGPKFLVKADDIEAEEGSEVTLNCIVDGHPHPDVFWLRYKNDRIVQRIGKSQNLTISVTRESAGQYWCRASVEGYPDIEARATVYVRGPPKIVSNTTQYGVEGDSVKIDCVSSSIPKPDYVIWSFDGAEINSYRNQEYAFLEDNLPDGMTKSTLIIRSSDSKHFGLYNCTVANLYGADTVQVQLIPDKSIPFVVVISGGASSAVVVLIIMLMIMLCHRKTRKSIPAEFHKKPDLTDLGKKGAESKDCDRHSNISDLKLELRQVEGSCNADNSNQGSERDFNAHPHLNPNLGLPLAGPVSLPTAGLDLELMKRYQRYSNDFSDHSSIQFKQLTSQSNGYIPYVDYSRDYIPPTVMTSDSLTGSLTRSVDTVSTAPFGSQTALQRMGQGGPDVIPMNTVDLRYAATYGNPYLRVPGPGPLTFITEGSSATHAAPPYYFSTKTSSLPHHTSVTSIGSPPSLITRSMANQQPPSFGSSSAINGGGGGAQPQVPRMSPQAKGALYVLPAKSQGNGGSAQITIKNKTGNGTHV